MPKQPYMPHTADGINTMLVAFDTNIPGALAAKYKLTAEQLGRVTQGRLAWGWFMAMLEAVRNYGVSLTHTRDTMQTAPQAPAVALPGGPVLPAAPTIPGSDPAVPVLLEPGFFAFFSSLVAQIKNSENYDSADGRLLGIEGAEIPAPDPQIVPVVTGDLFTSGHPELTCKKGQFEGYIVSLTRPGQPKKQIGFATSRRYNVTEPLPAPGTAEIWIFEVQYQYQGAPFGQVSQPLHLTVRG